MRFITDMMLGRLARWLRLLGFDTLNGVVEDDEILRVASQEGRILLTRDRDLFNSARRIDTRSYYIQSPYIDAQMLGIFRDLGMDNVELDPGKSRCAKCNGTTKKVDACQISGEVPPKVKEYHQDFWACTKCGKIYWMGRHWENIEKEINDLNRKLCEESDDDGAG
jgi:uncharacterized protein with PIN domain